MSNSTTAKSRAPSTDASRSAFICFGTGNPEQRIRHRAKFNPKRRQEVENVRKRGACLRCRLLKIPCSGGDGPCASCMKIALATSRALEGKLLRWTDCIRTSLSDVKFFDEAIRTGISQQPINTLGMVLAETPVTLEFASQMTWEINSFTKDVFGWLDSREAASTSKVGAMSSPQFQDLIKPLVGQDVSFTFRLMIYAISLARTQQCSDTKYQLSTSDLQKVGALAGKRCLKFLDKALAASSLATIFKNKDSKNKILALFLLAFGAILAIGYAEPASESPAFATNEESPEDLRVSRSQTLHKAMQNHLCRTLAHHVVYLGTRLDFQISSELEKFILKTAQSMWNKEGRFLWKTASMRRNDLEADGQDEDTVDFDYLDLDLDKWPAYWTESPYTGDGYGSQAAGTSTYGEHAASSLQRTEDTPISADLDFVGPLKFDRAMCARRVPHLPLNVPGPGLPGYFSVQGCEQIQPQTYIAASCYTAWLNSQQLLSSWLLV